MKCFVCVANKRMYFVKEKNGTNPPGTTEPIVQEAVTWAPSWQQQQIGMQAIMACVSLPTCYDHVEVRELSALDKAMMGGKILPGTING